MALLFSCPDLPDLLHFHLGVMADAEADSVEMHLADCERCLARLDELHPRDTLIDAMRSQETLTDRPKEDVRVRELMRDLKGLYPAHAGATPLPQHTSVPDDYDFLAPPQQPGEMGRLGPYRILRVLGAGGMGVVFEAEDSHLHRRVALKALRPGLASSASARLRFLREARAAAAVEHDHLVPIYQVGEAEGVPFLAMQLLQGESLESRLERVDKLPLAEVTRIGQEIAEGLSAAHRHGLIHRDIKPANIWLERKEQNGARKSDTRGEAAGYRVKILDFGLARAATEESGLTHPGVFVGTPLYGAPEQAGPGAVDHRCDLFSLGSVLYALCTGQPPFAGATNLAVLRRVCDDTPRPLREINPEVPEWLAALIAQLLAKDPAQRHQSAAEVAEALAAQRGPLEPSTNGQSAPLPGAHPQIKRWAIKRWATAAALLLLPLAALGLTEAAGITEVRAIVVSYFDGQTTASDKGTVPVAANQAAPEDEKPAKVPRVYATALFVFDERGGGKGYGAKVTDLLFAKLAQRSELFLVDRDDLKKSLQELELNLSGAVKAGEATRVGQLTGAKLLVSGAIVQVDKKLHLIARIVGTETSRLAAVEVVGKITDELGPLVEKLAEAVADKIAKDADTLVAAPAARTDRLAELNKKLKKAKRPVVMIKIGERHVGRLVADPAAQTELTRYCKATGFTVIDPDGAKGQADILITGEGISELAGRNGGLVSVKARVELKAVDRRTDKILAADRQTIVVVDLGEQIAGKAALEQAAAALAERLLPKLVAE